MKIEDDNILSCMENRFNLIYLQESFVFRFQSLHTYLCEFRSVLNMETFQIAKGIQYSRNEQWSYHHQWYIYV